MQNDYVKKASEDEVRLIDDLIGIRRDLGINQTELARMVELKQQSVSRIEKKEHNISIKAFLILANALGYTLQLKRIENESV